MSERSLPPGIAHMALPQGVVGADYQVWFTPAHPGPLGLVSTVNGDVGLLDYRAAPAPVPQIFYKLPANVVLSAQTLSKVAAIAAEYHAETGKCITINSGTRTALSQASAMYTVFNIGGAKETHKYRARAQADRLYEVFSNGRKTGSSKSAVVAAMAEEIKTQIDAGVYISLHLRANAVDVRSIDMNASEMTVFRRVATRHASSVLLEKSPRHWHLQF